MLGLEHELELAVARMIEPSIAFGAGFPVFVGWNMSCTNGYGAGLVLVVAPTDPVWAH